MPTEIHFSYVDSPVGRLTLVATEMTVGGVYFDQHRPAPKREGWVEQDGRRFDVAREWLARYIEGMGKVLKPPPLGWTHGTDFQKKVWLALQEIPWGKTVTYGELAIKIGATGAVRAVGAAVGRNPLSIMVPCHRVIGAQGRLTGYAGGIERKKWLLEHEGVRL